MRKPSWDEGLWAGMPEFKVNKADVAGSFKLWKCKFGLWLRMNELKNEISHELKLLSLLSAIGDEGLSLLHSKGIETRKFSLTMLCPLWKSTFSEKARFTLKFTNL